jgi:hypothetical protein
MIDPVTAEVLTDFGYPTDLTTLFGVACQMLSTNDIIPENDLRNMRIRRNELIANFVYLEVTKAYGEYRQTLNRKKPKPVSMKRNAVISAIQKSSLTESHSSLNPILELEKSRSVTYKGEKGIQKDEAFTEDKRAYNESMLGIMGISTSAAGDIGIVRELSLEPNITSTRGYMEVVGKEGAKDLNAVNLLTPSELLSPMGIQHDDPDRTALDTCNLARNHVNCGELSLSLVY